MQKNQPFALNIGQGLSIVLGLPTISIWHTVERPKKPKRGTIGFNAETNSLEYWTGTSWMSAPMEKA